MTDLRKEARGRECQVRYVGVCNGNPETTVLAHIRMAGLTGTSLKSQDLQAAWCCSSCHDVADGRECGALHGMTAEDVRIGFYEGVLRTQAKLIKEGKVRW